MLEGTARNVQAHVKGLSQTDSYLEDCTFIQACEMGCLDLLSHTELAVLIVVHCTKKQSQGGTKETRKR